VSRLSAKPGDTEIPSRRPACCSRCRCPTFHQAWVDGVEAMRQRVRELLRAGAEWIKICTSGGVLSQTDVPSFPQYTPSEIEVAVVEARAVGKSVMAHALGTQGIKNAISAGVKSIEHGVWLDVLRATTS